MLTKWDHNLSSNCWTSLKPTIVHVWVVKEQEIGPANSETFDNLLLEWKNWESWVLLNLVFSAAAPEGFQRVWSRWPLTPKKEVSRKVHLAENVIQWRYNFSGHSSSKVLLHSSSMRKLLVILEYSDKTSYDSFFSITVELKAVLACSNDG